MSDLLFGQNSTGGVGDAFRSIAQGFLPTEGALVEEIEVCVRTTIYDDGAGRNKRAVLLDAGRTTILGSSAWTTDGFGASLEEAWFTFTLTSSVQVDASEKCWLGVEFQLTDATEDKGQFRAANPPNAFTSGSVFGTGTPSSPRTIYVPAAKSAALTDAIDGVNVVDVTLTGNGDWAIRAYGNSTQREGWGMLI